MAPINSPIVARASDGCPSTISGGGIAGIVLGSIAGTLLILWLWRVFRLPGAWSNNDAEPDVGYRAPVARSSSGRRRRRSRVDYVEKPVSVSRRYRDDVRRPQKVYLAE
ncbi:hypothetical protein PENDEC_c003G00530 [Penicillium decumbens]|uniref:Uncharacterized protein n=1 Tax=Penicillium decumbens TaxID=69771 RepID=A0A1V6PIN4_PENDC|nr:hypothetical protein PENDEC_c003G00530 [Penicillium decumbens]